MKEYYLDYQYERFLMLVPISFQYQQFWDSFSYCYYNSENSIINSWIKRIMVQSQSKRIEHFNNETIYIFNITDTELKEKNESYLSMKFTINKTFLYMSDEFQQKYNFTVVTHFIDVDFYMKGFNTILCLATDLETMFIIDFLDFYQENDIQLMNQHTNETWSWNVQQFESNNVVAYDERIYTTVIQFIKCVLGTFLQSIVASIYMKMSIICAPILIIYMVSCMQICQNEDIQAQALVGAFPWVGQYLTILNRNHKLKQELLNAFIQMLILFYLVYFFQFSGYSGSIQLFAKSYPRGLSENFFSSFLLNEFVSIIFLRTRSSLYFVPKYITLTYLLFIYYFESTIYGYYNLAFQICIFSQFAIISIFVLQFEIAALEWSTISPYTPSFDRPRVLYCPMFNMNWVNDIPTLWTMFFPLCGRRFFQIQNLALVDKNYILLNNLLNQEEPIAIENNAPAQVPNIQVQLELPQQQEQQQQQQQEQQQQQQQAMILPQIQEGQINQQVVINVDNILGNDQPQQQNQLL
ncbi:unnamed protein product [Paramecium primaurelia]|uniref:Transmembrane protein n=1 Tax=Paramecium primaurelia TaxID=5886 RepID=A0A8S1M562_PARPR|nr:unnamed protein product [Paramecium primaurelia]